MQNELLAYRDDKRNPYSQTYLKTVHNQLSAIFNHAVRYYDLRSISMLYGLKKERPHFHGDKELSPSRDGQGRKTYTDSRFAA